MMTNQISGVHSITIIQVLAQVRLLELMWPAGATASIQIQGLDDASRHGLALHEVQAWLGRLS